MRNVGWFAGYTQPVDERSFLLQQTGNIEQALPIGVDPSSRWAKLTKMVGKPVLVLARIRGYRNEDGPQAGLVCLGMDRPSVLDLPTEEVWASGFGHGRGSVDLLRKLSGANFSPFDENGQIRPEYREYVTATETDDGGFEVSARTQAFLTAQKMLGDVLEASDGVIDSRLGSGQNYASVAGFVDAKAWVPDNEHRRGYALLMIRQHENLDLNIPVRVTGKLANAYFRSVLEGTAVCIEGSIRRKAIPKDEDITQVASRHMYVETTRVGPVQGGVDLLLPIPDWWTQIRDRLVARKVQRDAARLQSKEAAVAKPAEPAEVVDADDIEGLI